MADRGRILPPPSKDAGGNWARESRRSAPSRIANPTDYLHAAAPASGTDVRSRLPASRPSVARRNLDAPADDGARFSRRAGARRVAAVRFGDLDVEGSEAGEAAASESFEQQSPTAVARAETMIEPFSRAETGGDVGDGNDSDSSYNSFTLRLQKKSLFQAGESVGLAPVPTADLSALARTASPASSEDKNFSTTVYRIYRSYYRGNLFQEGNLTALFRTGTNRKMFQHELSKPLFRWLHVENPTMSFNNFTKATLDCPWLDDQHRSTIEGIFKVARIKSERSLAMPTGKKGAYVEPEYYEEVVNQTIYQGFRSRREKTEYIRWMCVPYFFVRDSVGPSATKTGTELSDMNGPSFPLSPMNTGYVLDCQWFQVAQLWVLIVGENLLITCARRSVDDLAGKLNELNEKVIDIKTSPPAPSAQLRNSGDRAPVIVVSDGGIRTWLLPIEKCETWAAFCSNFAELGIDFFEGWIVLYRDFKMTRKDWPKLVKIARKASVRLRLERRDDEDSDDSVAESDTDDDADLPEAQAVAGATTPSGDAHREVSGNNGDDDPSKTSWHVFTLMATIPVEAPNDQQQAEPATLRLDSTVLHEDADEINYYLSELNRRHGELDSYLNCPEVPFQSVQEFARTLRTDSAGDPEGINENKIHLFRAARHIFTFFYPLTFDHIVARKFWGAVDRILRDDFASVRKFMLRSRIRSVRNVHHAVDYIKEELFFKRTPAYNQTNVPHEFIQAWLMILMFFVLFPTPMSRRADSYPKRSQALLTQGTVKVIKRLQTDSLRDRESVSAIGTTALLVGQLLENARGNINFPDRQRLMTSYWNDLQRLVHNHPLSRKFQDRFIDLKSEFEILTRSIEEQQRVLVAFEDSINEGESKSVIPPHSLQDQGRESNIIEYCLQNTETTLFNFAAMERKRSDLESWHFRTIDTAKDRQEKAALTFTTVTVFFLPLTMLASVLGMNTADIRNMNEGQWLFWVTAVPLSAIGLLAWLAYLGTLKKWYGACKSIGRTKAA